MTAVLIAAFIFVESRVAHPLVPLRFFRSRNVAGAVLVRALFPVGMFGSFFLGALYLQRVLGYSPIGAGLAFMPMNICVALFSLLVTARVVKRFGAKATLIPGLVLMTAGLLLLGQAPVNAVYAVSVLPALLVMGIGAGLIFMPSVLLAMSGVNGSDSGLASGVANVAIQMGAAVGVAVLASISAADSTGLLSAGREPQRRARHPGTTSASLSQRVASQLQRSPQRSCSAGLARRCRCRRRKSRCSTSIWPPDPTSYRRKLSGSR